MRELESRTFTPDELAKLKEVIKEGVKIQIQLSDLRESLKDTVAAIASTLDVKPKLLNAAIRAAYKEDIADKKSDLDDLEEILHITGL